MTDIVAVEIIAKKIYMVRGRKVMMDRDLAELYSVETRVLKQAVRRNIGRFPVDFMFVLSKQEFENWRSQIVISNSQKMGLRRPPMAFTEQGVAMLSSVLKSENAIQVNIQIIRTFTRVSHLLLHNDALRKEFDELKQQTNEKFKLVFDMLDTIMATEKEPKRKIGF